MSSVDPTASGGSPSDSEPKVSPLEWARGQLSTGAIILGEEHTRSFTRKLILKLIAESRVKRLFLELMDFELDFENPEGPKIGKYLRTRRGNDIANDEHWTSQSTLAYRRLADKLANDVPLSTLIEHAVKADAKVYLIDNNAGVQVGRQAMILRNQAMGKEFETVMTKKSKNPQKQIEMRAAGSVILVGADHLNGTSSVTAACKLADDRALDLSKY